MSTTIPSEVNEGLEGVVAFATEIAEPDRAGGALRYRGVDVEELAGRVPFEQRLGPARRRRPAARAAAPATIASAGGAAHARGGRDARRELQAALARLPLRPLIDTRRRAGPRRPRARRRRRRSSFAAQSRRAVARSVAPVAARRSIDRRAARSPSASSLRGAARPTPRTRRRIDAYWITAAEHGMNASTFTARVVASTGADAAAALSRRRRRAVRPAARRCARARADDARRGRARGRRDALRQARARPRRAPDGLRPPRLPRRGPARPRAAPDRARARRAAPARPRPRSSAPRCEELRARKPDRVLATNVEFWSAVVLDFADDPAEPLHCRCSPARAPRAGRRTSSSRSAPAA